MILFPISGDTKNLTSTDKPPSPEAQAAYRAHLLRALEAEGYREMADEHLRIVYEFRG